MSEKKSGTSHPNRLSIRPKIKPLDPDRRLAPYSVPAIPPGKFQHCEGQAAIDFGQPDASDMP